MRGKLFTHFVALLSITALAMVFVTTSCGKPNGQILNHPGAVKNFSGTGVHTSELFTISGPDWAISWDFNPDPLENGEYANYFELNLQRSGDSSQLNIVPRMENISRKRNQRAYVDKSGKFQLEINSAGGNWQIRVYDFGR